MMTPATLRLSLWIVAVYTAMAVRALGARVSSMLRLPNTEGLP
jgi:hypothetical protein